MSGGISLKGVLQAEDTLRGREGEDPYNGLPEGHPLRAAIDQKRQATPTGRKPLYRQNDRRVVFDDEDQPVSEKETPKERRAREREAADRVAARRRASRYIRTAIDASLGAQDGLLQCVDRYMPLFAANKAGEVFAERVRRAAAVMGLAVADLEKFVGDRRDA